MTLEDRLKQYEDFMCDIVPISMKYDLIKKGFFIAPASRKYHGSYEGGLFDHSYNVAKTLVDLTEKNHLSWSRYESPYIIGMFHDLCKIDSYKPVYENKITYRYNDKKKTTEQVCMKKITGYEWTADILLKGHGDKSVMLLSQYIVLTEEEIMCIRYHMGAFTDKEEWSDYTRAIHEYPGILWTHHADMIASHIMEVEND